MTNKLNATHPGEFLRDEMDRRGMTVKGMADALGWTAADVDDFLAGKFSVEDDLADDLSIVLGTSPELWINLQRLYDEESNRESP